MEQKLFKLTPPESVISIKPQLSGKDSHKDDQKKLSISRTVSTDWSEKKVADKLMLNVDECAELDSGYMKSVGHVLEQFTSVLALESVVTHHELGYTGTLDCVVKYKYVIIYKHT